MKPPARRVIDTDPDGHAHVDALVTASYKLACGCTVPPSPPTEAGRPVEMRKAGSVYECGRHGRRVITRSTFRLVGWVDAPPPGWRP